MASDAFDPIRQLSGRKKRILDTAPTRGMADDVGSVFSSGGTTSVETMKLEKCYKMDWVELVGSWCFASPSLPLKVPGIRPWPRKISLKSLFLCFFRKPIWKVTRFRQLKYPLWSSRFQSLRPSFRCLRSNPHPQGMSPPVQWPQSPGDRCYTVIQCCLPNMSKQTAYQSHQMKGCELWDVPT